MMKYPDAKNKSKVGSYSALVFSGGGYFYDEILEYRVWVRPQNGDEVHFYAYADYEMALDYAQKTEGAEDPLVLVLQKTYIDEPTKGNLIIVKEDRITEWRVEWLLEGKGGEGVLEAFIAKNKQDEF